jgi:hypothetical protein
VIDSRDFDATVLTEQYEQSGKHSNRPSRDRYYFNDKNLTNDAGAIKTAVIDKRLIDAEEGVDIKNSPTQEVIKLICRELRPHLRVQRDGGNTPVHFLTFCATKRETKCKSTAEVQPESVIPKLV